MRYRRKRESHGYLLIEAVAALAVLAFGLLALVRMQLQLTVNSAEAQQRVVASALADEILSVAAIFPRSAGCLAASSAGGCSNTEVAALATEWRARVAAQGMTDTVQVVDSGRRLEVQIEWARRLDLGSGQHKASTDVRAF